MTTTKKRRTPVSTVDPHALIAPIPAESLYDRLRRAVGLLYVHDLLTEAERARVLRRLAKLADSAPEPMGEGWRGGPLTERSHVAQALEFLISFKPSEVEAEEIFERMKNANPSDARALMRSYYVMIGDLISLAEGKPCSGLGVVQRAQARKEAPTLPQKGAKS